MNVGELLIKLGIDKKGFSAGLTGAQAQLQNFSNKSQKLLTGLKVGFLAAGAAAAAFGVSAVKSAAQLDKSLREVSTLLNQTVSGFNNMRASVLALSSDLGIAADDTAKALYQAVSAGNDLGDALRVVDKAGRLAIAGVAGLTESVDLITTVMNAWGLEASEVERINDTMFTTVRLGKTTISELAASMGDVAPIAAQLGIDIDQVGAAVAELTTKGLSTNKAMTGLRAIMSAIIKPSEDAKKAAEELGIDFSVTALQAQGLGGFLAELQNATNGNLSEMSRLIPQVEAIGPALSIAANNAEGFTEKLKDIKNGTGAAAEAFDVMEESITRKTEKLKTQINNFATEVGNRLVLFAEDAIKGGKWIAEAFGYVEKMRIGAVEAAAVLQGFPVEKMQAIADELKAMGLNVTESSLEKAAEQIKKLQAEIDPESVKEWVKEAGGIVKAAQQYEEWTKKLEAQNKAVEAEIKKQTEAFGELTNEIKAAEEAQKQEDLSVYDKKIAKLEALKQRVKELKEAGFTKESEALGKRVDTLIEEVKTTEQLEKQKELYEKQKKEAEKLKQIEEERARALAKSEEAAAKELERMMQDGERVKEFLSGIAGSDDPAVKALEQSFKTVQELLEKALPEDIDKLDDAFQKMAENTRKAMTDAIQDLSKRISEARANIQKKIALRQIEGRDYEGQRQAIVADKSLSAEEKRAQLQEVNKQFQGERNRAAQLQAAGFISQDQSGRVDELIKGGFTAQEALGTIEEEDRIAEMEAKQEEIAQRREEFDNRRDELLAEIRDKITGDMSSLDNAFSAEDQAAFDKAFPSDAIENKEAQLSSIGDEVDMAETDAALNKNALSQGSLLETLAGFGSSVAKKYTELEERTLETQQELATAMNVIMPGGLDVVGEA